MDVGELELFQALDEMGELGDGVVHFHALEAREWRETNADLISTDGIDDGAGDLQAEAGAVLDAAAVLVGAGVAGVLGELVDEVAVCAVDLDAVEAGLDGIAGGLGVVGHELLDVVAGHFFGDGVCGVEGVGGRRDDFDAFGFGVGGVGGAAQRPQLAVDVATFGVDGGGDGLPGLDLGARVDARNVGVAGGAVRDEGRFGDEERARDGGALGVVGRYEGEWHVGIVFGAEARQRSHDEAVV